MKEVNIKDLRNVCLMAHGGSGKTTLAEAMLFNTGVLDRFGKVPDGTTTCDFEQEEIKRQISINTSIAPCEWNSSKINIIDTPGYFDFVGEVKQGIRVADSALILLSGKDGISVGTEKSWGYSKENNLPRMFFISKMDEENANFDKVLSDLQEHFGNGVVPFQLPIIENEKFVGYVDIINMKAYKFDKDKLVDTDIPSDLQDTVTSSKDALTESVAESSEELMEKFFNGDEFTPEEMINGIRDAVKNSFIFPVFCGSAINNQGVSSIMNSIIDYLPSPDQMPTVKAYNADKSEEVELKTTADEKLSALVFKTIADPFVGKISLFRVYSGTLTADSVLYNSSNGKQEKVNQIFALRGKKQVPIKKLVAGDIGAVAKLQYTNTNNTLCDPSNPVSLEEITFPVPNLFLAVEPASKGDEEKIHSGLTKLMDEDPTFKVTHNTETHQTLISGLGEQHLDIIVSKLKSKFGVSVTLTDPKVPYRETIRKKVKVEGKHKKQSGGHGQYGHVWIEFEPGEGVDGLTFEEKIFGGSVPKQYFPAVEKGLLDSIQKGVLAGFPVVNLKATLVDGSYHAVDSSEMAFKMAANIAFKKGLKDASPALLEPVMKVQIWIPDNYMGDVIGDLNKRRGRILGMTPQSDGSQQIEAEVPQSEMFSYSTDLRSMTQARGYFEMNFERYEEVPSMLADKVIESMQVAVEV
jgi:elongation factor G